MQHPETERRYHHGDLRRAIIDTALELICEEQNAQFTLREIARRVGVSNAAPYKHFPDKSALLTELAMIGYDRLDAALLAAQPNTEIEWRDALLSVARAYFRFGIENADLYRLMFCAEGVDDREADTHARVSALLAKLADALKCARPGDAIVAQMRERTTAFWSFLHGMTMLSISGLLLPEKFGRDPLASALERLVDGIAEAE